MENFYTSVCCSYKVPSLKKMHSPGAFIAEITVCWDVSEVSAHRVKIARTVTLCNTECSCIIFQKKKMKKKQQKQYLLIKLIAKLHVNLCGER